MNTIAEVNDRLSALVTAMMAKGLRDADAQFWIMSNNSSCVCIDASSFAHDMKRFYRGTNEEAFASAESAIAAVPDPETLALNNHLRRVADCIDEARKDGIDDAYVTPLVPVREAMTSNLLAAEK